MNLDNNAPDGRGPLVINRPFAIFIEPGDVLDGKLQWYAKIVGHELDNFTWGDGPIGALSAVIDLVKDLVEPMEEGVS